jgi:uncharacterized protein
MSATLRRDNAMPATSFVRLEDAAAATAGRAPPSTAGSTVPSLALIHGEITHRRRRPVQNTFTYPAFCLRLPLSELASLPERGIAHNTAGLVSFHDRDHGACDGGALEPWIGSLLAAEGIDGSGEVVLYAFPRMLGYVFNPVSFWVCHDGAGAVRAVLCEVRNTFGERHNYLVAAPDNGALVSGATCVTRKMFHVSPFCEVKGDYRFRFSFGAERWLARIDYFDDADAAEPLLETWISGEAAPVDPAAVRRLWWRYRFFTVGVVARIHWQALKLALKRVPFFPKPAPPRQETTR